MLLGYSTDSINDFMINLGLRGIARLQPHCVKQAEAITPAILLSIYSVLDMSDKYDVVYWCLFLFAFFSICKEIKFSTNHKQRFTK